MIKIKAQDLKNKEVRRSLFCSCIVIYGGMLKILTSAYWYSCFVIVTTRNYVIIIIITKTHLIVSRSKYIFLLEVCVRFQFCFWSIDCLNLASKFWKHFNVTFIMLYSCYTNAIDNMANVLHIHYFFFW